MPLYFSQTLRSAQTPPTHPPDIAYGVKKVFLNKARTPLALSFGRRADQRNTSSPPRIVDRKITIVLPAKDTVRNRPLIPSIQLFFRAAKSRPLCRACGGSSSVVRVLTDNLTRRSLLGLGGRLVSMYFTARKVKHPTRRRLSRWMCAWRRKWPTTRATHLRSPHRCPATFEWQVQLVWRKQVHAR